MALRRVRAVELRADDRIDGIKLGPILKEPGGPVTIRLGQPGERRLDADTELEVQEQDRR